MAPGATFDIPLSPSNETKTASSLGVVATVVVVVVIVLAHDEDVKTWLGCQEPMVAMESPAAGAACAIAQPTGGGSGNGGHLLC